MNNHCFVLFRSFLLSMSVGVFCVWDGERHMYSFVDVYLFSFVYFLRIAYMGQTDAARRGRGGMGVRYSSSFVASNRYGMVWYIDMEELYCRILLSFYHEEVAVIFVSSRSPACSVGNFLVALVCRLEPGFVFDEVWVGIGEVLSDGWVRRRIFGRVFDGLIVRDCLMGENRLLGLSCLSSI
jgi:hypothetical protein